MAFLLAGTSVIRSSQKSEFPTTNKKICYNTKKELRHHGAMKKHTVCRSFLLKKGVVFHEINRPR